MLIPNVAGAASLFDIHKSTTPTLLAQENPAFDDPDADLEQSVTEPAVSDPHEAAPDIKAWVDSLKEKWHLTEEKCEVLQTPAAAEYCEQKRWKMQLELFERKKILDLQKNWRLSKEYCDSRSSFRNYAFCQSLLIQQNRFCAEQKTNGTRLIIDLDEQVMYGLKNCELVVYTRITSGKNSTPTPIGSYRIYQRRGPHWMQGEWFVNKAFYFRGGYAIHDAGWRLPPFWRPEKRAVHGSHGCINTPGSMMEMVWDKFDVGDTVAIYRSLPDDIATELKQKVGTRVPFDPESSRVALSE